MEEGKRKGRREGECAARRYLNLERKCSKACEVISNVTSFRGCRGKEGGEGKGRYLVGVDEGLTDGQLYPGRPLKVHADEGSRHGRVAGQEERPTLLQHADEPVTDGVAVEVRPVVAHPHNHRRRLVTWRGTGK